MTKYCQASGRWKGKENESDKAAGWTDYSPCFILDLAVLQVSGRSDTVQKPEARSECTKVDAMHLHYPLTSLPLPLIYRKNGATSSRIVVVHVCNVWTPQQPFKRQHYTTVTVKQRLLLSVCPHSLSLVLFRFSKIRSYICCTLHILHCN